MRRVSQYVLSQKDSMFKCSQIFRNITKVDKDNVLRYHKSITKEFADESLALYPSVAPWPYLKPCITLSKSSSLRQFLNPHAYKLWFTLIFDELLFLDITFCCISTITVAVWLQLLHGIVLAHMQLVIEVLLLVHMQIATPLPQV